MGEIDAVAGIDEDVLFRLFDDPIERDRRIGLAARQTHGDFMSRETRPAGFGDQVQQLGAARTQREDARLVDLAADRRAIGANRCGRRQRHLNLRVDSLIRQPVLDIRRQFRGRQARGPNLAGIRNRHGPVALDRNRQQARGARAARRSARVARPPEQRPRAFDDGDLQDIARGDAQIRRWSLAREAAGKTLVGGLRQSRNHTPVEIKDVDAAHGRVRTCLNLSGGRSRLGQT